MVLAMTTMVSTDTGDRKAMAITRCLPEVNEDHGHGDIQRAATRESALRQRNLAHVVPGPKEAEFALLQVSVEDLHVVLFVQVLSYRRVAKARGC